MNASGATAANYAITYVQGTLSVAPATLTITADDKSKVYGTVNPAVTVKYSGFVNGDGPANLDTPVTLSTPANAASPWGHTR